MTRASLSACLGAFAALATGLAPATADAAGFALFEQGARGMGFAGAYTAQASDPSAIFHNAAGIAFLKGKQIYLGGTLITPSTDFTGASPYPGDGRIESMDVGTIPTPSLYYTQAITDRLVAGVGLDTPFGLKTEWANPDSFTGRFVSTKAELKGFAVNPTVAYKVADRFSIGGGLDIRFSSVGLYKNVGAQNPFTQRVVDVATVALTSGTKTGFGFNVGALAKPSETISVGVSYRHKVKVDYDGSADFTRVPTGNAELDALVAASLPAGAVAATTSIEYPSILSGGVAYTWNDWTFEGDVNRYQWSTFDQLPITLEGHPELSSAITENYKDSWQFRFGAQRRINDAWSARGGYFFDQTPSPAASVSPLLPDANRHGVALGGTWTSGRLHVDGAAWYIHANSRSTEGVNRDHYDGTYDTHVITLGLSLGYSF